MTAGEATVSQYLDGIRRAKPGDFVPLTDFNQLPDGPGVEQDSRSWTQKFFSMAANPYQPALPVKRSVHHATTDTFDILRHEYNAVGKQLVVDETANVILITVDEQSGKADAINQTAGLLLKMSGTMVGKNLQDAPYQWAFQFPASIGEGTRFSTNPSESPMRMWSWAMRLDGGIYQHRLYFLAFKQREQSSGKVISPDGQHWFDGKAWDAFR